MRQKSEIVFTEAEVERFWGKVDKSGPPHPRLGTPCWVWTAATNKGGYGCFGLTRGSWYPMFLSHRFAYTHVRGTTPVCVLHHCDNPPCCNPDHLYPGTRAKNNADMTSRDRHGSLLHEASWIAHRPRGEGHARARMTWPKVKRMRALRGAGWTYQALSVEFQMSMSQVANICTGRHWEEPEDVKRRIAAAKT